MRRTGATTRIVDFLIQQLFANGKCKVFDKIQDGEITFARKFTDRITRTIEMRLQNEHHRVKYLIRTEQNQYRGQEPYVVITLMQGTYEPIDKAKERIEWEREQQQQKAEHPAKFIEPNRTAIESGLFRKSKS